MLENKYRNKIDSEATSRQPQSSEIHSIPSYYYIMIIWADTSLKSVSKRAFMWLLFSSVCQINAMHDRTVSINVSFDSQRYCFYGCYSSRHCFKCRDWYKKVPEATKLSFNVLVVPPYNRFSK